MLKCIFFKLKSEKINLKFGEIKCIHKFDTLKTCKGKVLFRRGSPSCPC